MNRSISTETGRRQRTTRINDIPAVHVPGAREEAAHPAFHATVIANDGAGLGVEALAFISAHGAPLDEVAEGKDGREAVAELDDTECSDDGDEAEEIGDGSGNYEGDGPVDGHDGNPHHAAGAGGQWRCLEQVHKNVVVEDLNTDITIETCGDDAGNDGEDVASRLPAVRGDTLVGELVGVSGYL